jgi:siroheme synthase (precorrin-2 oxidase/ferrochelatase)
MGIQSHDPSEHSAHVTLPVMLDLRGRRVVVVGVTPVADERAAQLRGVGADVVVVDELGDPEATLAGAWLVFAACGTADDDQHVVDAATALGIWANAHDRTDMCAFQMPAIFRRGPLTVAVGTGGAVPTLAVRLRDHIATIVGPDKVPAIEAAAATRAAANAAGSRPSALDWDELLAAILPPAAERS